MRAGVLLTTEVMVAMDNVVITDFVFRNAHFVQPLNEKISQCEPARLRLDSVLAGRHEPGEAVETHVSCDKLSHSRRAGPDPGLARWLANALVVLMRFLRWDLS